MSKFTRFLIAALTVVSFCSRMVRAESVEQITAEALRDNVELRSFEQEIAAAKGTVRTAETIRNPELSSQAGYKNSRDNSGGGNGDGPTWSVSLMQTFEYPGRIALRKAIANHDVDLAELHLQNFRVTLAARVRALAYSIVIARDKIAAVREATARIQALSDVLEQRPSAGISSKLEAQL